MSWSGMRAQSLSRVWLFVTSLTLAHQAPLFMGFSRQEYWSRLPFPFLGDLPNPRIGLILVYITGWLFTVWATREAPWVGLGSGVGGGCGNLHRKEENKRVWMKRNDSRGKWEGAGQHSVHRRDGTLGDIESSFALLFTVLNCKFVLR